MGLDMYLYRQLIFKHPLPKGLRPARDELASWRKAYAIDKWFHDHCEAVEGSSELKVTESNLKKLNKACKKVLGSTYLVPGQVWTGWLDMDESGKYNKVYNEGLVLKDTSVAKVVLPDPREQYDEIYWLHLERTMNICRSAFEGTDFRQQELRYWSWK